MVDYRPTSPEHPYLSVRRVPLCCQPRCFFCGSFLPHNPPNPHNYRCSSCGVVHDLAPKSFKPTPIIHTSVLQPNGKITKKKITVRPDSGQLALFGGVQ